MRVVIFVSALLFATCQAIPTAEDDPFYEAKPSVGGLLSPQINVQQEVDEFRPNPLERQLYAEESAVLWSYDTSANNGPEEWGGLDSGYAKCSADSKDQSPVDLYSFRIASPMSPLITPQYKATELLIRNTGNYLRLIPSQGSELYYGDKIFDLLYAQVKTPAEHRLAGESFPLEIQFVHKAQDTEQMAVLSLLYKQGLESPFIARLLESIPAEFRTEKFLSGAVNLGDVIPRDITQYKSGTRVSYPHYVYDGSLSTPPCRENVKYFVWPKPEHVSKDQIASLMRIFSTPPSRPVQNMNGRVVEFKTLF